MKALVMFKRSVRNGVLEAGDLTHGELVVAHHGVVTGMAGGIGVLAAKFTTVAVASKVLAIGGVVMVGVVFGKAFVRGYTEQMRTLRSVEL